jgi:hypothetical protein
MASPTSNAIEVFQSWTYEPLSSDQSFRLFELWAAQEYDDPLVGSVAEQSLAHLDVKYFALSYVWGEESDPAFVLDGQRPSKALAITRNLEDALRHLRHICKSFGQSLILWVDSICINQDDLGEKSHQIPLMCDIYRTADSVFVWLGREDQYADYPAAFEYLCILFNEVKPNLGDYEKLREEQEDRTPRLEEFYPRLDPTSSQAIAFAEFFRNTPWFHRAWTMQESVVAQKKMFLCGESRLPDPFRLMPSLYELASYLEALDSGNTKWVKHCIPVPELLTKMSFNWTKYAADGERRLSLRQCLDAQRGAGCKDARDIVYSVLGLVQDPQLDRTRLVPDYQKPLAVVYTEALAEIIRCERSVNVLSSVDYRVNTCPGYGLPSWVPDWKTPVDREILYYSSNDAEYHFHAATSTGPPVLRISRNFRELMIAGLRITKIESIVNKRLRCAYATVKWDDDADRKTHVTEALREVSGKADGKVLLRQDPATGKRVFHIAKGSLPDGSENKENVAAYNILDSILNTLGEDAFRFWPIDEEQEMRDHSTNEQLIAISLPSVGRLARTERGSLAIVNEATLPGDIIIVPFGGQVPLLLRPKGKNYSFIGECFLSGCMYGEALSSLHQDSEVGDPTAHQNIEKIPAITAIRPSGPGSSSTIETVSSSNTSEKWVQVIEDSKSWVPGKDPANGEWFTLH